LYDADDTNIADEHDDVAHVPDRHVADGLPERSGAASGHDNLPVIRGYNRNGSGPLVFL
jgi:hypothetical protein